MISRLLFLFYCCLATFALQAQTKPYLLPPTQDFNTALIKSLNSKNGLPTTGILDMAVDRKGYFWFVNQEGIIRYDGLNFKVFNKDNTPTLTTSAFRGVLTYPDTDTIYFTSFEEGLWTYYEGSFKQLPDIEKYNAINPTASDEQGRAWGRTKNKKTVFYKKKTEIYDVLQLDTAQQKKGVGIFPFKNRIFFIFIAKDNTFQIYEWLAVNVIKLIATNEKLAKDLKNNKEYFTFMTDDGQNFAFDGEVVVKENFEVNEDIWNSYLEGGTNWKVTTNHLYRKQGDSYKVVTNPLFNATVWTMTEDPEGNMWFFLYKKGILISKMPKIQVHNAPPNNENNIINSVVPYNDSLLLVAFDRGEVSLWNKNTLAWLPSPYNKITDGKRVKHVLKDSKQNWWFATYHGLVKIDPQGKSTVFNKETGWASNMTRFTFEDKVGNLWIATKDAYVLLLKPDGSVEQIKEGITNKEILAINQDLQGNIWLGTGSAGAGINKLENKKVTKIYDTKNGLAGNVVFNIYIDKQGIIWAACSGGLSRIDDKNNQITSYTPQNGLPFALVLDIKEDSKGNFWVIGSQSIAKIAKQELEDYVKGVTKKIKVDKIYDKYDGLLQTEGLTAATHTTKTADDWLYMPAIDGFAMMDLKNIPTNPTPPPTHIETASADQDTIRNGMEVAAGKKHFTFQFTAIDYYAPEKVRFRYQLEGFDTDYIETDYQTRQVAYTNLSAGKYVFHVWACNNDGVWTPQSTKIAFSVLPHFYQTWWFFLLCLGALLVSFYLFYKWRVYSYKKKQEELEHIVALRTTEISQQKEEILQQAEELKTTNQKLVELDDFKQGLTNMIVHDLKNPLNVLLNLSIQNPIKQLEKVKQYSKQMLNQVLNILDVQKYAAAEMNLDLRPQAVHVIAESAINEVVFLAAAKSIVIQNTIDRSYLVLTEQEILHRVFVNILTNAIKYTPLNGAVTLKSSLAGEFQLNTDSKIDFSTPLRQETVNFAKHEIAYTQKDEGKIDDKANDNLQETKTVDFQQNSNQRTGFEKPNDHLHQATLPPRRLVISITDTGQGIPADKKHLVFQQFGQVDAKSSGTIRSTGLGMTFCKMAVEAHGGIIDLDSEVGKGTTFWFTLLLAGKEQTENPTQQPTQKEGLMPRTPLSQEDKKLLQPYYQSFNKLMVYETSELEYLLHSLSTADSEPIKQWKQVVYMAMEQMNEEKYKELILVIA